MTIAIALDASRCQGYANCLIEAPDIFDFDEEENRAVLKLAALPEALRARAEAAVRCCPAQAISIEPGT